MGQELPTAFDILWPDETRTFDPYYRDHKEYSPVCWFGGERDGRFGTKGVWKRLSDGWWTIYSRDKDFVLNVKGSTPEEAVTNFMAEKLTRGV